MIVRLPFCLFFGFVAAGLPGTAVAGVVLAGYQLAYRRNIRLLSFRRDLVLSIGLTLAAAVLPILARLVHGALAPELVQAVIAGMAGRVPAMNWGGATWASQDSLFAFAIGWHFTAVAMVVVVVPCWERAARKFFTERLEGPFFGGLLWFIAAFACSYVGFFKPLGSQFPVQDVVGQCSMFGSLVLASASLSALYLRLLGYVREGGAAEPGQVAAPPQEAEGEGLREV